MQDAAEETCSKCHEYVLRDGYTFGIKYECGDACCVPCLKTWCESWKNPEKQVNECPICARVCTKAIIPSNFFGEEFDAKENISSDEMKIKKEAVQGQQKKNKGSFFKQVSPASSGNNAKEYDVENGPEEEVFIRTKTIQVKKKKSMKKNEGGFFKYISPVSSGKNAGTPSMTVIKKSQGQRFLALKIKLESNKGVKGAATMNLDPRLTSSGKNVDNPVQPRRIFGLTNRSRDKTLGVAVKKGSPPQLAFRAP